MATPLAGGEQVGDAGGEHARLAGAGAGQHQHRPLGRLDGGALLGVQLGEIVAGLRPARPRGDAAGFGGGGQGVPGPFLGGRVFFQTLGGVGHQARKSTNPEGRTL